MLIRLNLKRYKILNLVLKKYLKKTNLLIFGQIKKAVFSAKKCNCFPNITTLKYIIPTAI